MMKIKIGTRKSKLALVQTKIVAEKLKERYPKIEIEIISVTTKGDRNLDKPLAEFGGKGVFVSEIEKMLQNYEIDIAVHSAKDLPVELADGLEISGVTKRSDYRDVLVIKKNTVIKNEKNFVVGTGSVRRRENFRKLYPNVSFSDIRGNVDTRLDKLFREEYNAIIIASAGIKRLALDNDNRFNFSYFDYMEFLPSPCQGIIAVESRKNDVFTPIINSISDTDTFISFKTERQIIKLLNGGCGMPLGAYSFVENGKIFVTVSKDGRNIVSRNFETEKRIESVEELIKCL